MKLLLVALLLAGTAPIVPAVQDALNTGANAVFEAAGAPNRDATKIVPVVAQGGGSRGYAQITGPAQALKSTAAVVEINTATAWSITAFIPVSKIDASSGTFHRVYGVAVDALVNHSVM